MQDRCFRFCVVTFQLRNYFQPTQNSEEPTFFTMQKIFRALKALIAPQRRAVTTDAPTLSSVH